MGGKEFSKTLKTSPLPLAVEYVEFSMMENTCLPLAVFAQRLVAIDSMHGCQR